jgi:hypothetical protein
MQILKAIGAQRAYDGADAGGDRSFLLDDFSGSQNHPRSSILCKDLSDTDPAEATEAIRVSEAVFFVSTTARASVGNACAHVAWLRYVMRSLQRDDACGLLLVPTSGGMPEAEAERLIGLPICGVLRSAYRSIGTPDRARLNHTRGLDQPR